jgi:hypothetical protein
VRECYELVLVDCEVHPKSTKILFEAIKTGMDTRMASNTDPS